MLAPPSNPSWTKYEVPVVVALDESQFLSVLREEIARTCSINHR